MTAPTSSSHSRAFSPQLCVDEAMRGMLRHKTIIIVPCGPDAGGPPQPRSSCPPLLLMPIMARQQKRKLGKDTFRR